VENTPPCQPVGAARLALAPGASAGRVRARPNPAGSWQAREWVAGSSDYLLALDPMTKWTEL
jgi:hypothetical protein